MVGASLATTALAALGIAAVHLWGSRLLAMLDRPGVILSAAGGAAVAYVFVEALPALRYVGEVLATRHHPIATAPGDIFLLALLGLVTYYALDHVIEAHLDGRRETGADAENGWSGSVFGVHLGGFLVYDILIGYLLVYPAVLEHHRVAFAVAMGLHLLGTDYDLRRHDERRFRRVGRWLLAGGVLAGATLGSLVSFGTVGPAIAYAFLVGGVVLNALKGELPVAAASNLPAFLLGVGGYTALLVGLA